MDKYISIPEVKQIINQSLMDQVSAAVFNTEVMPEEAMTVIRTIFVLTRMINHRLEAIEQEKEEF